jgi:hypothetical protein
MCEATHVNARALQLKTTSNSQAKGCLLALLLQQVTAAS